MKRLQKKKALLLFIMSATVLWAVGKAPTRFNSLPRLEQTPHDANELLCMQTVCLPIDTINRYIEQNVNYGNGTSMFKFGGGDSLIVYDAYGVYESDSLSILYYRASYSHHEEIKAALNPFVARYPSTLLLYRQPCDGDSLPSWRFNYADDMFNIISQISYFDMVKIVTQKYSVDIQSNRFKRQEHTKILVDKNNYVTD